MLSESEKTFLPNSKIKVGYFVVEIFVHFFLFNPSITHIYYVICFGKSFNQDLSIQNIFNTKGDSQKIELLTEI